MQFIIQIRHSALSLPLFAVFQRLIVYNSVGLTECIKMGSVTLCGILLFPGVLQFAGKQTRRAADAWGTAPLKRDRARAAARVIQLNEQK